VEGSVICKTDEVGEIVVSSPATASSYWGLPGLTQSTFKVEFILQVIFFISYILAGEYRYQHLFSWILKTSQYPI
jgi:hypothetical protein